MLQNEDHVEHHCYVKLVDFVSFFKLYSYQSLKDGVSRLLRREGFLEKCEKWRDWNKILTI